MSPRPGDELALDDRALDDDIERLRASTEHYIDTVRAAARRVLADGEHPEDAMVAAADSINRWLVGRGLPYYAPLRETVDTIVGFIERAHQVMSADETVEWFTMPARELRGRSPVEALVGHRYHEVEVFVRWLEDAKRNAEGPEDRDEDSDSGEGDAR